MIVKNNITGQQFETTTEVWNNIIVNKEKYTVIEDDKPIEIKQLSVEVTKRKNQSKK